MNLSPIQEKIVIVWKKRGQEGRLMMHWRVGPEEISIGGKKEDQEGMEMMNLSQGPRKMIGGEKGDLQGMTLTLIQEQTETNTGICHLTIIEIEMITSLNQIDGNEGIHSFMKKLINNGNF